MSLTDDGLFTPTVGPWAEEKYKLLSTYADIFATSMKDKWDKRVYVDLFAGAGRSRIRESRRIVHSSPILAMGVSHQFDKYVFSEINERSYDALKKRVDTEYQQLNKSVVGGDANELVEEIVREISDFSPGTRVLTFCFVDPYRLRDLRFNTIKALAQRYVDFLILIPTGMDAMRNMKQYQRATNKTVEEFLGDPNWRIKWSEAKKNNVRFDKFIMSEFESQMKSLDYKYGGSEDSKLVRSTDKNLHLYRLAFFSRNATGGRFWKETRKYSDPQRPLFE